ncbi:hypothetical protein MKW98_000876 [Papaver atlanticum]|uniref:Uncharacterized protein n=1 Tax=Papaver atlanticum TaxID=357466 RepID=A0AAD4XCL2_9MAGN|nr:hypothetical protein MKW98_000876 [Papaver atlanticum]
MRKRSLVVVSLTLPTLLKRPISIGASGDYYDYGSCNAVRKEVPMSSCDQCVVACASRFTKPLCAYDAVNKGAYVCTCCI